MTRQPINATPVDVYDPGSPEWLAQRALRLGGSEIAAVIGLSPHESRFSLWHRKLDLIPPVLDNDVMEWGRRLEDAVLTKFRDEHPALTGWHRGSWVHPEHDWMLASPDAVAYSPDGRLVIVDAKTGTDMGVEWGEQPPVWYVCQLGWYMEVLDADESWIAALLDGRTYREYRIERNREDGALLIREGREFIQSLLNNDRPSIDDHSATYEVLRTIHPDIDREAQVEVSAEVAGEYLDSVISLKHAETRLTGAKSALLEVMGDARVALIDGPGAAADRRFAYRTAKSSKQVCPDCNGRIADVAGCGTCTGVGAITVPGIPYPTYYPKALQRLTTTTALEGDAA